MEDRRRWMLRIDDEQHIVDFVVMGLEGRKMDVEGVLNSRDALLAVEEFRPDVIVSDLMLPGPSGLDICK